MLLSGAALQHQRVVATTVAATKKRAQNDEAREAATAAANAAAAKKRAQKDEAHEAAAAATTAAAAVVADLRRERKAVVAKLRREKKAAAVKAKATAIKIATERRTEEVIRGLLKKCVLSS